MILESLYQMALDEGLVQDPDVQNARVTYAVSIDAEGQWVRTQDLRVETVVRDRRGTPKRDRSGTPKTFLAAPTLRVPSQTFATRTSGVLAYYLVDKAEYALGLELDAKSEARRRAFRAFVEEAAETSDPALTALTRFLGDDEQRARAIAAADPEQLPLSVVAFRYAPDESWIHERPAAIAFFRDWRRRREGAREAVRCMVTGELQAPARTHPRVKPHVHGLEGALPTGTTMVSFNFPAAEAYGLKGSQNAPIGQRTAEAISAALNRLLDPAHPRPDGEGTFPRQFTLLSPQTVAVFWSPGAPGFAGALSEALGAEDAESVRQLVETPWMRGAAGEPSQLPARVHWLSLSFSQARIVIRRYLAQDLDQILHRVRGFLEDCDPRDGRPSPSLYSLLRATVREGADLPVHLAEQAFTAVLRGSPFPRTLLQHAVLRAQRERGSDQGPINRTRACLLQAVLRRSAAPDSPPAPTAFMDESQNSTGYLLGRLFSVLARLQSVAHDRPVGNDLPAQFYEMASTRPAATLPRLFQLAQAHLKKARRGRYPGFAVYLHGLAGELSGRIAESAGGRPPRTLSLEEQAAFGLGFYAQERELDQSARARRQERESATLDTLTDSETTA